MNRFFSFLFLSSLLVLAACSSSSTDLKPLSAKKQSPYLKKIQNRGRLLCGINTHLPGFGFKSGKDNYSGFDIDIARALATAMLGSANKLQLLEIPTSERFESLSQQKVDVLVRNTTVSLERELRADALLFSRIYFYDGLGIMVPSQGGIRNLYQLQDISIGVLKGSSAEENLARQLAAKNLTCDVKVFKTSKELLSAFRMGRVVGVCADKSALASMKATLPNPDSSWIMDVTLTKEPFAVVSINDSQVQRIITWVINAMILAEEYGITSKNVDHIAKNTTMPHIRRLLGLEGKYGPALGLKKDWAYQVIKQVGNYREIYERNLGSETIFNIPRGANSLYLDRGLLYSPPLE